MSRMCEMEESDDRRLKRAIGNVLTWETGFPSSVVVLLLATSLA